MFLTQVHFLSEQNQINILILNDYYRWQGNYLQKKRGLRNKVVFKEMIL